jgi:glycosyltransferase involved in cell wall biosynthesis
MTSEQPAYHPVLLTPGPPSRPGGQYYAVWATALLQQIYPEVRLMVPGRSAEALRLERFVRSFRLPAILRCTGARYSLEQLLHMADVFVAPAIADQPTNAVERAMAAGLPVVATDVPAFRELIRDDVTGLLVPPAKPTRLAGAVLRVYEDRSLRERLTEAARKQAGSLPVGLRAELKGRSE